MNIGSKMAAESAELTPMLQWVPKSMLQAADLKLQQGWRIVVRDDDGKAMGSRIEWRDVPVSR